MANYLLSINFKIVSLILDINKEKMFVDIIGLFRFQGNMMKILGLFKFNTSLSGLMKSSQSE